MLGFIFLFIIFVILLILSNYIKDLRIKKIISIISLVILCLISGTRYNIGGSDYFWYKNLYQKVPTNNIFEQLLSFSNSTGIEKGFVFYMSVVKILGFNFYGFTLINSIIFYSLFYKALKHYNYNINFILVVFLYKMFFYNTFISIRQPIAIIIFWLALPFLKEKKYIKYFLMCFVAFLFHRSSIVLFFIPFITHFKISKNSFLLLLIIGLLSFVVVKLDLLNIKSFIGNVLSIIFRNDTAGISRAENYLNSSMGMSIFYLLEYYSIALLVYRHYDKIMNIDENSEFFIKLFICLLPLYTVFHNFSIVTRFKDFFFLSYPIMLIYISKCLKKNKIILFIVTVLVCFYGYIRYINNFDNGELKNYSSYIFERVSIFNKND